MTLSISTELLDKTSPKTQGEELFLWRRKTLNIYRGVIETSCSTNDPATVSEKIRTLVKEEFDPGSFIPFAFGTVLHFESEAPPSEIMASFIDTRARSEGTWQWLVVTNGTTKRAYGVHTWMEGYLTPVYLQILKDLENSGYACSNSAREPERLFRFMYGENSLFAKFRSILSMLGLVAK